MSIIIILPVSLHHYRKKNTLSGTNFLCNKQHKSSLSPIERTMVVGIEKSIKEKRGDMQRKKGKVRGRNGEI